MPVLLCVLVCVALWELNGWVLLIPQLCVYATTLVCFIKRIEQDLAVPLVSVLVPGRNFHLQYCLSLATSDSVCPR